MPLFSEYTNLEEADEGKHKEIHDKIRTLADSVKFPRSSKIVLEVTYDADLHSNASTTARRIEISDNLLKHHAGHEDEILAILCHEFGHWDHMHLYRSIPIDTLYMVLFALFMTPLINNAGLLQAFGFKQESYIMSIFAGSLIWNHGIDWFAQIGFLWLSRYDETDADRYAV